MLSIDGLQPEKGHETLYVVRELTKKRVWFGEPLVSSSAPEVRRLIARAREWAERLGKRVRLWISDKQDAFLTGLAAEFPDVPHRFCQNHFLRDVAQPMLEADSHAKVRMRSKVRGLRAIEKDLLEGPSMIHALDLHLRHPGPLTSTDLLPFRDATPHISQLQSLQRRSLMRRARSTKKRPRLLEELESRYKDSS